MQPRAPFMATAADRRHSAQPSEMSTDTAMTLAPGVEYSQKYSGFEHPQPQGEGEHFEPYGAVHSNLTTTDAAPLQHPPSPARYTDHGDNLGHLP
jgi:hypothetical protein